MNKVSGFGAVLALVVAMALWGSSFVAFKYAVMNFDPFVVVFGRLILASLVFAITYRYWKPKVWRPADIPAILFMALCEPCLYYILEAQALRLTSAAQAGMVSAILPVFVALGAWLFLKERLVAKSWIGLILALGGVVWVSLSGQSTESSPHPALGNFLELLAMLFAAAYTISMKKLCATYSPWFMTAVQVFVGAVFFLPLLFLPNTELPTSWPLLPSLSVIYLGTAISIGAYGLYNFGISKLPAWQAGAFINLIPVFSIFLGWICLGETMSPFQLLGVGLVFVGVLLAQEVGSTQDICAKDTWRKAGEEVLEKGDQEKNLSAS